MAIEEENKLDKPRELTDQQLEELKLECMCYLDYHPLVAKVLEDVIKEIQYRLELNQNYEN